MKRKRRSVVVSGGIVLLFVFLERDAVAQETDYEFVPPDGWRGLSEIGDDDASARLAEGFEGLAAEPGKETAIEPVDGSGGFDNVAPRLGAEEGPGGLDWDPSPTYRTRYKGGTDYLAGSGTRVQGNNWFTRIPYAVYDGSTDQWRIRFDANTFRVYTRPDTNYQIWWGRFGNKNSKLVRLNPGMLNEELKVYDTRGKTYSFPGYTNNFKCTKIEGLGGSYITITYNTGSIVVLLKKSGGTDVLRFTYTLASNRIDKIDIEEKIFFSWYLYRKIDFTYHEEVTGAVEGTTGDLIGIKEETLLSPANTWLEREWVFKYFTGTYNSSTNPGYPYQVKAVLGPQSVHDFKVANPSTVIYTQTAAQLASYVDRTYEYHEEDKRVRQIEFKSGCGCGGGEGIYGYTWDVYGSTPSDLNSWSHRVTITLPSVNGSSRIIDYNDYGQTLNSIAQEVAGNPSSRRWIETFRHDTTGRLTDSYSVKACTSYSDSTHVVTTNTTAGERFLFSYGSNSELNTVKLRDPGNGNQNFQRKKAFTLVTSGDRRRFLKTSETAYPNETTTDTGGVATTFAYTYHASDALAVKKRTTTLPKIKGVGDTPNENGAGLGQPAGTVSDYFETDGLNTWSEDGDTFVHYTGYDASRRTVTKRVQDVNTASLPAGVPAPPTGEGFDTPSGGGLNLVTDWEYDLNRRPTKVVSPAFNAWDGTSVASVKTTRRWYYTKLSGGEGVTLEYPHVDTAYYHAALNLTVRDFEGHVLTSALGELGSAYRNTNLDEDFDKTQSTLAAGFKGAIVRRTDQVFVGDKLDRVEVWSDADNGGAAKFTTTYTYDASGRRLKATNPVGTITKWSHNVFNRVKSEKLGTQDGGGGDNMTLVEERFYDDEEDSSANVGDGNLTRVKRYASQGGTARTTDHAYDYRRRLIQTDEPLSVRETRTYTNRNQVKVTERRDVSSGSVLMAKSENFYDAWGQVYEVRISGVSGGSESGYANERFWRNGRGLVVKAQSRGKVFKKAQYDGAGRVANRAVSYHTAETAYADADDLAGDTVIQETRYVLDGLGAAELVRLYERRHNGTGTGGLTVGTSGNSRAQYRATWYDPLHRAVHAASYGTYGGSDLTARPTGSPPSASSANELVAKQSYTIKSEPFQVTGTMGIVSQREYDNPGRLVKRIDNYSGDGTPGPGPDENRRVEYSYNALGQVLKTTQKAAYYDEGAEEYVDRVTENIYGVARGASPPDSLVASNDLLKLVKYPDPDSATPGQPSEDANDQLALAYDAQGALIWRLDAQGTERTFAYDARSRLTQDLVTELGSGLDGTMREVARTYDALDRPELVTAKDSVGDVLNEVKYEYDRYGTVAKLWQDPDSIVSGASPKVQFAHSFPSDGTTGIRRTSTTYPSGKVINDVYNSGADDILSRITQRTDDTTMFFQDMYLGLGRLVERHFGAIYLYSTLVGTDSANQDNYAGLDRFGRIDLLTVKNTFSSQTHNQYSYSYNYRSQATLREDLIGNVSGSYEFDETIGYDDLGRVLDHQRGAYSAGSMSPIRLHECWTYDRLGNVTAYYGGTSSSCTSPTITQTFNASNEIASRNGNSGYALYDDLGNLTRKGLATDSYIYDAWGRQVQANNYTQGTTLAIYKYNGLGQVTERTNSPSQLSLRYYYDATGQVVEERATAYGETVYNWYVWGTQGSNDLAARGPTLQYYAADAAGSTTTRFDSSGNVVARYVYEAYGKPSQLSANWSTWQSIAEDLYLFGGHRYWRDHAQYSIAGRVLDPDIWSYADADDESDPVVISPKPSSCPTSACCEDSSGGNRQSRTYDPCKGEQPCPDGTYASSSQVDCSKVPVGATHVKMPDPPLTSCNCSEKCPDHCVPGTNQWSISRYIIAPGPPNLIRAAKITSGVGTVAGVGTSAMGVVNAVGKGLAAEAMALADFGWSAGTASVGDVYIDGAVDLLSRDIGVWVWICLKVAHCSPVSCCSGECQQHQWVPGMISTKNGPQAEVCFQNTEGGIDGEGKLQYPPSPSDVEAATSEARRRIDEVNFRGYK